MAVESVSAFTAAHIRELRCRQRMSQAQLARASQVSVRTIRDMENGHVAHPHQKTLGLVLAALLADDGHDGPDWEKDKRSSENHDAFEDRLEFFVAGVRSRLLQRKSRLITISGLPGVGKSAALHALIDQVAPRLVTPVEFLDVERVLAPGSNTESATGTGTGTIFCDFKDRRVSSGAVTAFLRAHPLTRVVIASRAPLGCAEENVHVLHPLGMAAVSSPGSSSANVQIDHSTMFLLSSMRDLHSTGGNVTSTLSTGRSVVELTRIARALDGLPGALLCATRATLSVSLAQTADRAESRPLELLAAYAQQNIHAGIETVLEQAPLGCLAIARAGASVPAEALWAANDMAQRLGIAVERVEGALPDMFLRGLVFRHLCQNGEIKFRLPNLVRHVIRNRE